MATIADLKSQIDAKLELVSGLDKITPAFDFDRVRLVDADLKYHSDVHAIGFDRTAAANLAIESAEARITIMQRDTGATLTDAWFVTFEELLLDLTWWETLAAVRASPVPEVEITSEPELTGEVFSLEITARIALEV